MNQRLKKAASLGQGIWIDSISRDDIEGGDMQKLIDAGVVGVTSNPTIFQKAISTSSLYDDQLTELSAEESDPKEIFLGLAKSDIRDACDLFAPVYEKTDGLDGYVSLEVSPDLAYDTSKTIDEAFRLHEMVDKPNLLVKIPATRPGLAAIEEVISRGKSVNVTLIFSLDRYRAVANAYIRGLHRLVAEGGDPSGVASVASFFVSRVDSEADARLDEIGKDDLKGKLAVANAKLAYAEFEEIFSGKDWEFLESKGATKQRPLWASTSSKNPDYPDLIYVEPLFGKDTVNTMPLETLEATMDQATVEDTVTDGVDDARKLLKDLAKAGVDYDDVTETLEQEGVQKFEASFVELLDGITDKTQQLASKA